MDTAYSLNLTSSLTPEQEAALEDYRLISGLQAGEEEAYERLIDRFQAAVYNLAWRLLSDPADASDVVQEVFLKIFRNVASFRGESTLRTWVYRIAVNESHNRRRWLFRHRRGETGIEETFEDSEGREKPLMDSGETPFDFTMNREAQILLEEGLAAINPVFRAALVLREIEDMSYDEIPKSWKFPLVPSSRGLCGAAKLFAAILPAGSILRRRCSWFQGL